MLFNSYPFLLLLIITFITYYSPLFRKRQILVLIASSMIFYGYNQPYLLILLAFSASVNAITSFFVFHRETKEKKYSWAFAGVVLNLFILAFFKYNHMLSSLTSPADNFLYFMVSLPLPIGISFYTFQGISLVLDIYDSSHKYDIKINKNFWNHYKNTFFFITFFPQLVAGPIVKAHDFFPQISAKRLKDIDFIIVFKSLVVGYFLKSVIADNLKDQTFWIASPYFNFQSSLTLVTMLFGYSMQIFADFAGYSLIAIGTAAIFGYKLPDNFNFPYISSSLAEFWRRWHISLSSWLKEYLYFSLGGNKKGSVRTYVNLLIVMFLGGMWHGAALNYGVWGLWHGIGLMIERAFSKTHGDSKKENSGVALAALKMLIVFIFVSFGWLLFKLTNINEAIAYIAAIAKNTILPHNHIVLFTIPIYSAPIVLYHLLYIAKIRGLKIADYAFRFDYVFYAAMIALNVVNGGIPGAFVYFQF